jgi:hypothetical protein
MGSGAAGRSGTLRRAEGESRARELLGRGEAARISQMGEAEANLNRRRN